MEFFCGLDVAIYETAVCVVDDHGAVHVETTAVTDPDALFAALKPFLPRLRRVGHKAGALSPWLHPELKKIETAYSRPVIEPGMPLPSMEMCGGERGCFTMSFMLAAWSGTESE